MAHGTGAAESYQTGPHCPLTSTSAQAPPVAPHGRLCLQGSPLGALFRCLTPPQKQHGHHQSTPLHNQRNSWVRFLLPSGKIKPCLL